MYNKTLMKSETKLFVGIILGTIAIVVLGIMILSRPVKPVKVDSSILVREGSHKTATESASVTLVEFSDFQCPACITYHPIVKALVNTYAKDMTLVYRNFPLVNLHKNAYLAAQAAEAAALQQKYWEMNNMLFKKAEDWSVSTSPADIFTGYAKELGLDTNQFVNDMNSDSVRKIIDTDIADGNAAGIAGTPTFFVNGQKIENPASAADFEAIIRDAISVKK